MLYISLVSCEILLFANANWIFSADHRSINMSLQLLPQIPILPRFFDAIFLLAKSIRFWRLKGSFWTPESSPSWSVIIIKTRGMRIPQLWFWHADLFLGGPRLLPEVISARLNFSARGSKNVLFIRQKSSGPCPILLACVPKL